MNTNGSRSKGHRKESLTTAAEQEKRPLHQAAVDASRFAGLLSQQHIDAVLKSKGLAYGKDINLARCGAFRKISFGLGIIPSEVLEINERKRWFCCGLLGETSKGRMSWMRSSPKFPLF